MCPTGRGPRRIHHRDRHPHRKHLTVHGAGPPAALRRLQARRRNPQSRPLAATRCREPQPQRGPCNASCRGRGSPLPPKGRDKGFTPLAGREPRWGRRSRERAPGRRHPTFLSCQVRWVWRVLAVGALCGPTCNDECHEGVGMATGWPLLSCCSSWSPSMCSSSETRASGSRRAVRSWPPLDESPSPRPGNGYLAAWCCGCSSFPSIWARDA